MGEKREELKSKPLGRRKGIRTDGRTGGVKMLIKGPEYYRKRL